MDMRWYDRGDAAGPKCCSKELFQKRRERLTFVLGPEIRIVVSTYMLTRSCLAVEDGAAKAGTGECGIVEADDVEEKGCMRDWEARRSCGW